MVVFLRAVWAVFFLVAMAGAGFAHAEFRGSAPAANSLIQDMPAEIRLTFSEAVGALVLEWILPDGRKSAAQGAAGGVDLTIAPPAERQRGTHVLRWRVASADGHPVGGALVFSVGEVTGGAAEPTSGAALAAVLARGAFVLAVVLAVGGAVFHHLVAPLTAPARRIAVVAAGLALPLAPLWLMAEGADRLGIGAGVAALAAGVASPVARSVGLALAAILLLPWAFGGKRGAALAALGLAAASFAASGHGLAAGGAAPWLTGLHGGAMLLWVGGLLPLTLGVRAGPALPLLARFSRVALPAVVVLGLTGLGLGLAHRGVPGVWASD